MSSVWIRTRLTSGGEKRHRVEFRPGGREEPIRYGGSFKTLQEARARKLWIAGELAAQRMPDLHVLAGGASMQTLAEVADAWRASRVDLPEHTRGMHTSSIGRIWKVRTKLGSARVGQIAAARTAGIVAALHEGKERDS